MPPEWEAFLLCIMQVGKIHTVRLSSITDTKAIFSSAASGFLISPCAAGNAILCYLHKAQTVSKLWQVVVTTFH